MSSERLLLIGGPPGSGKSSVAEALAQAKGMEHLSMGNYLRLIGRQAVRSAYYDDLQAQRDLLTKSARLPRGLVLKILEEYLLEKTQKSHVLIDGYPRAEDQVDPFFELVEQIGIEPQAHISLTVTDEVAVSRMISRGERRGENDIDHSFAEQRLRQHTEVYPAALSAIERHVPVHEVVADAELEAVTSDAGRIIEHYTN